MREINLNNHNQCLAASYPLKHNCKSNKKLYLYLKSELLIVLALLIGGCAFVVPYEKGNNGIITRSLMLPKDDNYIVSRAKEYCSSEVRSGDVYVKENPNFAMYSYSFTCSSAPLVSKAVNECSIDSDCKSGFSCRTRLNSDNNECRVISGFVPSAPIKSEATAQPTPIKSEPTKQNQSVNLEEFKVQCKALGFKVGTTDFGNCVLQLNEAK